MPECSMVFAFNIDLGLDSLLSLSSTRCASLLIYIRFFASLRFISLTVLLSVDDTLASS